MARRLEWSIRLTVLPVAPLFLSLALGAAPIAEQGETLRVFLVAGQSNAEGADTHASEVDTFPPFVGAAAPQTDVFFWYENGSLPFTSGGWIALQPELQRQILGPELTFARKVKGYISDPIAIVKSTQGGTNLAVDWDPGNPAGAQMYERTMTLLQNALASLNLSGIAWALEGVLWQQGENDMLDDTYVTEYGVRLTALIDQFRTDLGKPDLEWFVGATSDKCIWGMDYRDNMQILRNQQLAVVAADPLAHFVASSHLAFKVDIGEQAPHYHFGTEGQLQLGEAYADAYLSTIGIDVTHQSQDFCCGMPAEPGSDVRVFVLAGQRSMEGEGAHVAHIEDYPEFAGLSQPQDDVFYRYRLAGGLHAATDWAPLGPADYLGNFGPELSFGAFLDGRLTDPVAVVKVTHSAAVLRDWHPVPTDASLPQYEESIAFIQSALADLQSRGLNPVLEAVVWLPGEHDAWWTPFRVEYAINLPTLVSQMRADLGAPNLKWLVAELSDDLLWETDKLNELDAQIKTVAGADPRLWFVTTDAVPIAPQSPTFATEGTLHLGRRLAEAYLGLCPADINGDRTVDVEDLLAVLAAWGNAGGAEDLDGSGVVDAGDLLIVLGRWGECV
jgi:hypothetical protein